MSMNRPGLKSEDGFTLSPIPAHSRLRWVRLVPIYMSCMACVPLVMVGTMLARLYTMPQILVILTLASLVVLVFDWMNAAVGVDVGLPASVIGSSPFGASGARYGISVLLVLQGLGWYGLHVAVASRAFLLMLEPFLPGILGNLWVVSLATTGIGLLFAFPTITGQKLLGWTNQVSAIALLGLGVWGIALILSSTPLAPQALAWNPPHGWVTLSSGVIWLVGSCAAQFVLLADYTRLGRRITPDSFLLPIVGIVPIGFILPLFGSALGLSVTFGTDFFSGLQQVGLPFWALSLVVIAQWNPARVVNLYSVGLAMANISGYTTQKARRWFTLITVLLGVSIAMMGILDRFTLFLELQAFIFPAIGFLYVLDHFVFRKRQWKESHSLQWKAVISLLVGYAIALMVKNAYSFFLAAFIAGCSYSLMQWYKSKNHQELASEQVKPAILLIVPSRGMRLLFLTLGLGGLGIAGIGPLLLPPPFAEVAVGGGSILLGIGFYFLTRSLKPPAVSTPDTPTT